MTATDEIRKKNRGESRALELVQGEIYGYHQNAVVPILDGVTQGFSLAIVNICKRLVAEGSLSEEGFDELFPGLREAEAKAAESEANASAEADVPPPTIISTPPSDD